MFILEEPSDSIFLKLTWFDATIEPAIDSLEGNVQLPCKLNLGEFPFEAKKVELLNKVVWHGRSQVAYNTI